MNLEKIKYSKCPSCHKHGIHAFQKIYRHHNPKIKCKYCGEQFSVNFALSFVMKLFIPIGFGLLSLLFKYYFCDIPFFVWCILTIISWFVFEYFSPMEKE